MAANAPSKLAIARAPFGGMSAAAQSTMTSNTGWRVKTSTPSRIGSKRSGHPSPIEEGLGMPSPSAGNTQASGMTRFGTQACQPAHPHSGRYGARAAAPNSQAITASEKSL